jgi:hypothetical protein
MSRRRSRYAPDDQVLRAGRLAAQMGIQPAGIRLGADGSVILFDKSLAPALTIPGDEADAALEQFESTLEPPRLA